MPEIILKLNVYAMVYWACLNFELSLSNYTVVLFVIL